MPGIKAKRKQLVRKTLMRAKAQSERAAEQRQESPEEYAQTEVQQGISDVAARTGNTTRCTGFVIVSIPKIIGKPCQLGCAAGLPSCGQRFRIDFVFFKIETNIGVQGVQTR